MSGRKREDLWPRSQDVKQINLSIVSTERHIKLLELRALEQSLLKQISDSPYASEVEHPTKKAGLDVPTVALERLLLRFDTVEHRLLVIETKLKEISRVIDLTSGTRLFHVDCVPASKMDNKEDQALVTTIPANEAVPVLMREVTQAEFPPSGHLRAVQLFSPRGEWWWRLPPSKRWPLLLRNEDWRAEYSPPLILPASLGQGKLRLCLWRCEWPIRGPGSSVVPRIGLLVHFPCEKDPPGGPLVKMDHYNSRLLPLQLPLELVVFAQVYSMPEARISAEGRGIIRLLELGNWPGHLVCELPPPLFTAVEPPLIRVTFGRVDLGLLAAEDVDLDSVTTSSAPFDPAVGPNLSRELQTAPPVLTEQAPEFSILDSD